MITYKNSLKYQVDRIQKLIDEINEYGIEGFTMGGGNC